MKIAIIGNSGAGKSVLARWLAAHSADSVDSSDSADSTVDVLDLDLVFWSSGTLERPEADRIAEVRRFCREHESWIVEGCYSDLIEATFPWRPELIFMDPGLEVCISNCRSRPHEPHKYRTKQEQDRNLDFLLTWVADYYDRDGLMSHRGHQELFNRYDGPKRRVTNLDVNQAMR